MKSWTSPRNLEIVSFDEVLDFPYELGDCQFWWSFGLPLGTQRLLVLMKSWTVPRNSKIVCFDEVLDFPQESGVCLGLSKGTRRLSVLMKSWTARRNSEVVCSVISHGPPSGIRSLSSTADRNSETVSFDEVLDCPQESGVCLGLSKGTGRWPALLSLGLPGITQRCSVLLTACRNSGIVTSCPLLMSSNYWGIFAVSLDVVAVVILLLLLFCFVFFFCCCFFFFFFFFLHPLRCSFSKCVPDDKASFEIIVGSGMQLPEWQRTLRLAMQQQSHTLLYGLLGCSKNWTKGT